MANKLQDERPTGPKRHKVALMDKLLAINIAIVLITFPLGYIMRNWT